MCMQSQKWNSIVHSSLWSERVIEWETKSKLRGFSEWYNRKAFALYYGSMIKSWQCLEWEGREMVQNFVSNNSFAFRTTSFVSFKIFAVVFFETSPETSLLTLLAS